MFGDTPGLTVSDNSGPVLANAQVRLIFWGTGWSTHATLQAQVQSAFDTLNSSTYFYSPLHGADLSQYRPGSAARPARVGSFNTNYNSPGATFSSTDVSNMLQHEYGMTPQFYYFVVPDPNSNPTGCGCIAEHTFWTQGSDHEYFGFERNLATPSLDDLTNLYAHEMVESITDPDGTALQVNPRNPTSWNEISDGEAQNYSYRVNGVWAQSYWSRADGRFTVPTGQNQDFFVSASRVLTVNGDQLVSHTDTITLDVSGGGVRVTLNGEAAQFDPGQISSIVVRNGNGNDTINILRTIVPVSVIGGGALDTVNIGTSGTVQGIAATVNVTNPPVGGSTALNIDDSADGGTHGNVVVTSSGVTGLAPATIGYAESDLRALIVSTGTGSNTVNVQSTPYNSAQSPHTALMGHSGSTTVNVGSGGILGGIQGALDVSNPPVGGYTALTIDDLADGSSHPNVVVTSGSVGGLAPATISYQQGDLRALNINTGTGTNDVSVQSTPFNPIQSPHTALIGHSASTTVTVGNAGSLAGIQGALDVSSPPIGDYTALTVNDSADTTFHHVTLTSSAITGLAPATISYQQRDLSALTVNTGGGNVVIDFLSTPTNPVQLTATRLNGGGTTADLTTVIVGDAGSLQGIQGALFVADSPSFTALNIDDSADRVGQNVTMNVSGPVGSISGLAPAEVDYSEAASNVSSLTVNGGTGGNLFDIEGTYLLENTTVNAGSGGDIFRVTQVGQYLATIAGPLTLNGTGGGADILEFFDTANPSSETYNFDAVPSNLTLTTVPVSINFFGMGSVYLQTNGGSVVNDPSGTVIVDDSPPSAPGSPAGKTPSADSHHLVRALLDAAHQRGAALTVAHVAAADIASHVARKPEQARLLALDASFADMLRTPVTELATA